MPAELSVGVIIAAYEAERWIAEAIEDALAQDPRPVDVLVIDDGSTDATAAVAAAFGAPVRVIRQANAGTGAARNRGMAEIGTDIVAFLDADDRLPAHSFSCRLPLLAEDPGLDLVFGQVRTFVHTTASGPVGEDAPRPAHLPSAMLIRRSSLDRVGPFLEGSRVSESLDWMLRARELGLREATVPEQVSWRRVHGANNSLRHRAAIGEFAFALKASLDRRRAASGDEA